MINKIKSIRGGVSLIVIIISLFLTFFILINTDQVKALHIGWVEVGSDLKFKIEDLKEKLDFLRNRVTAVEGSTGGRLIGFNSYPVGTSTVTIPAAATTYFYSISGGGGGGSSHSSGGAAGKTSILTLPGRAVISAAGGAVGRNRSRHSVRAGARGGQFDHHRDGGVGQDGKLIEGYSEVVGGTSTGTVLVGAGGAPATTSQGAWGGAGWCKIWWYS